MSGKRAASAGSSSYVTSVVREAVFAGTTFDQLRSGLRSFSGLTAELTEQRSWSMKPPPTTPSFFKENTGTEPTPGTGWSTPVFVLTCVQPFSVKATLLRDLPRTSFCEEQCQQALGQILKSYENDIQIMLSSTRSTRSTSVTSRKETH